MTISTDNQNTGFIVIHRSILKWEWYDNINVRLVFMHLLLTVNWENKKWHGKEIKRGQIITSLSKLAKNTGLTVRQVRVTLDKLKMTGELTIETTNEYSLISITNYDKYQSNDKPFDNQMTNECQTNDKRMTTTKQLNKETSKQDSILSPIIPFNLDFITDESFKDLMQELVEHRKAIKKPFKTQRGVEIIYNKLLKLSSQDYETARLIVDESIGGGYQGIFALSQSAVKKTGNKILANGKMEGESTFDFNMRMTQERLKQFEREENNA